MKPEEFVLTEFQTEGIVTKIDEQVLDRNYLYFDVGVDDSKILTIRANDAAKIFIQKNVRLGDFVRLKVSLVRFSDSNTLAISDASAILTVDHRDEAPKLKGPYTFMLSGTVEQSYHRDNELYVKAYTGDEYYLRCDFGEIFHRGDFVRLRVSVVTNVPVVSGCDLKIVSKDDVIAHTRQNVVTVNLLEQ